MHILKKPGSPVNFYCGESAVGVLKDLAPNGKPRPWANHKSYSVYLADSYLRLAHITRAQKISECGNWLKFSNCSLGHVEAHKLIGASFCRQRLCPMCAWRRSLKVSGQVHDVAHYLYQKNKSLFLFLTLTLENVPGSDLSDTFSYLLKSYTKLLKTDDFKKAFSGSFRGLEVTIADNGLYHPHIHVLLCCSPSYFSRSYISQVRLTELWQQVLGVDYSPIVHIEAVKPKSKTDKGLAGAAAEVAKYTCKPGEYINPNNHALTDSRVQLLHSSLHGRRSYAYTGVMKEMHNQLFKGENVEAADADLVGESMVRCCCPVCESDLGETVFKWSSTSNNYIASKLNNFSF